MAALEYQLLPIYNGTTYSAGIKINGIGDYTLFTSTESEKDTNVKNVKAVTSTEIDRNVKINNDYSSVLASLAHPNAETYEAIGITALLALGLIAG
jgi:arginine/lysine/ornithine decarboxylase